MCPVRQKFVDFSEKDKTKVAGVLKMSKVEVPTNSVFVRHGHLQHANAAWNEGHTLWYHTFVRPEAADKKDAVAFGYHASPGCD